MVNEVAHRIMRTIYLSKEKDDEIEGAAKRLGVSYTAVVRLVLQGTDFTKVELL